MDGETVLFTLEEMMTTTEEKEYYNVKDAAGALTPDSIPSIKLTIIYINELTGDVEEQVEE